MTIEEFYDACERHDWYYEMSDDHTVWSRGTTAAHALSAAASAGGPKFAALLTAWQKHVFSGPEWGTEKLPKPERPVKH